MTEKDVPLWEEESVEILLLVEREQKRLYRMLVGPRGGHFDSVDGDAGWDAPLEVRTREEADAWVAVLAIPFADLGGGPEEGTRWSANFLRHRSNVVQETSAWAHSYESDASPQFGELLFQ